MSPNTCHRHTRVQLSGLQSQGPVASNRENRIICALWPWQRARTFWNEGGNCSISVVYTPHLLSQLCSSCLAWCSSCTSVTKHPLKGSTEHKRVFLQDIMENKCLEGLGCVKELLWYGCNESANTGLFCLLVFLGAAAQQLCSCSSPPASLLD